MKNGEGLPALARIYPKNMTRVSDLARTTRRSCAADPISKIAPPPWIDRGNAKPRG
jgi:hypothetical protein